MPYDWDEAKRQENPRQHGVDFADAVGDFFDDHALTRSDPDAVNENRRVTLGLSLSLRAVYGVWVERVGDLYRLISAGKASPAKFASTRSNTTMSDDIDFSGARRGALISEPGKERITIRLDAGVLAWFRAQVAGGGNYQTLINEALKAHIAGAHGQLEQTLRQIIREELRAAH